MAAEFTMKLFTWSSRILTVLNMIVRYCWTHAHALWAMNKLPDNQPVGRWAQRLTSALQLMSDIGPDDGMSKVPVLSLKWLKLRWCTVIFTVRYSESTAISLSAARHSPLHAGSAAIFIYVGFPCWIWLRFDSIRSNRGRCFQWIYRELGGRFIESGNSSMRWRCTTWRKTNDHDDDEELNSWNVDEEG